MHEDIDVYRRRKREHPHTTGWVTGLNLEDREHTQRYFQRALRMGEFDWALRRGYTLVPEELTALHPDDHLRFRHALRSYAHVRIGVSLAALGWIALAAFIAHLMGHIWVFYPLLFGFTASMSIAYFLLLWAVRMRRPRARDYCR